MIFCSNLSLFSGYFQSLNFFNSGFFQNKLTKSVSPFRRLDNLDSCMQIFSVIFVNLTFVSDRMIRQNVDEFLETKHEQDYPASKRQNNQRRVDWIPNSHVIFWRIASDRFDDARIVSAVDGGVLAANARSVFNVSVVFAQFKKEFAKMLLVHRNLIAVNFTMLNLFNPCG